MRRDHIGFVFQSFNLVPTLTAGENITLPVDLAGRKVDKEWFDYLVDQLGIADRLTHRPGEMSGGQQQRCACARALINRPDLVFADEPTGNLDSTSSGEMLAFLRRSVTEFGQSIVMVTHDPHGATYADGWSSWPTATSSTIWSSRPPTLCWSASGRWEPDMWRVTIKGLLAHKLRLALTALAIVLGVTFIAGTFVLTDTLHNTFNTLFGNIYQNVDFQVRGVAQFGSGAPPPATRSPSRSCRRCAPCPAWRRPKDRSPAMRSTSPRRARRSRRRRAHPRVRYDPNPALSPLRLSQGTAPTTPHDVVMDLGTAQKYHFKVGQNVRILLEGPTRTFTITGLARFGTANNLAGATLAVFDIPTAQAVLGEVGKFDNINVVAQPGANKARCSGPLRGPCRVATRW